VSHLDICVEGFLASDRVVSSVLTGKKATFCKNTNPNQTTKRAMSNGIVLPAGYAFGGADVTTDLKTG
jgi:hypothetical protein